MRYYGIMVFAVSAGCRLYKVTGYGSNGMNGDSLSLFSPGSRSYSHSDIQPDIDIELV